MRPEAESGGRIQEGSDPLFQSMPIWEEMASSLSLSPEQTGHYHAMYPLVTPEPRKMGHLHLGSDRMELDFRMLSSFLISNNPASSQ